MNAVPPRILVVGFGNTLQGDDGAGPAVIARLRELGVPTGASAEDGGSDSLRLPGLWHGEEEIWLVDAVRSGASPGTVHRVEHAILLDVAQRHATVHHLSLPESLRWIALAYPEMAAVRYRLWGIEVGRVGVGEELTARVRQAVDLVAKEIRDKCARAAAATRG